MADYTDRTPLLNCLAALHSPRKQHKTCDSQSSTLATAVNPSPIGMSQSRRQMLSHAIAGLALWGLAANAGRAAEPAPNKRTGLLMQPTDLSLLKMRAKIVLELDGKLEINEPDPKKEARVRTADVRGKSTLDYFESIAFDDDLPVAAARRYVTAKSENWVSGKSASQELRPECGETRLAIEAGVWQEFCPAQPLDAREVELLRAPLNTSALEQLLPSEPAKVDAPWDITKQAAKNVFNLEAVHGSTLVARISKVEQGVATIRLSGKLNATANSVPTSLELDGNFHAKLGAQCAFVSWLGLSIEEKREISQTEPGFTVTARIQMIRAEADSEYLDVPREKILQASETSDDGRWLVRLQSARGGYEMLADRRWTTYIDGGEEAILRMVENNTVIAQCNVMQLPKLDAGAQLTLEALQAEIRKSHGDGFGQFLESSEKVTSTKLRQMRVVLSGQREEVPIQWIYCHLSNDEGRRLAMEFTMGATYVEKFAAADAQMADSFEFRQLASTPSEAPKLAPQASAALSGSTSR